RRIFGPYVADVNSDGLVDLVWAFGNPRYTTASDANRDPEYYHNTVLYKLGQENQTFGPEVKVVLDHEIMGIELMDIDADGDLDLVMSAWGNKRTSLWTGSTFSSDTKAIPNSGNARISDV